MSLTNLTLDQVIIKVTNMVSYDNKANQLAKNVGLNINYVSWEDCARNKNSSWGPCISDMTLQVNNSCMPVMRQPNYTDKTWDVEMSKIPIVIGNQTADPNETLQTISLKEYLSNFSNFMSNDYYKTVLKNDIDLTSQQENKDTHVIMSSQTCFLPIQRGEETKFNVAIYNYQSQQHNPALLVIISTSKGTSAQIIEGKEQYLLFNNNGKKADFIGERVSDIRKKKYQKNINDKQLSKQEKQDNVIVIVQVPLKQKIELVEEKMEENNLKNCIPEFDDSDNESNDSDEANVEAAIVKISERTKPVCICNKVLQKYQMQFTYSGSGVVCNVCMKRIKGKEDLLYHCADGKNYSHPKGYDLCLECGEKQLKFDELRGLLDYDKNYVLERDERFPVRCSLQYYKATDNGVVTEKIMDDIVKQLECSQKQADFIGSLVVDYDVNRASEWIDNNDDGKVNDEYKEIRKALQEYCGVNWKEYMKNFEREEVTDVDLDGISNDDLKELITKIGPRNRFKKWMGSR